MNRTQKFLRGLFFGKAEGSQALSAVSVLFQNGKGAGLFGKLKYTEAVESGYKSLVWVYRCVKKRGENLGSVPWKVRQRLSDGTYRPLPGHPLEALMNRPNPYTDRKEFFEGWSTYLDLSGNCYIEVVFAGGKPVQLYTLRPDWMTPIPNAETLVDHYDLKLPNRKPIPMDPREVMHFKYIDPLNELIGLSPLEAASRTVQSDNAIVNWNRAILDNNAVPGGILTVPAQTLLNEDRKILQEEIEAEFGAANRGRPMILWGGMDWKQLGLTQRQLDFLEQRRLNKYEVCAIYGVPPQIIGANEDPTYSNWKIARLSWWEDSLIPTLDWAATRFNQRLSPYFGPDIELYYDISDVPAMRDSFMMKVDTAEKLHKMSWPINAINDRLNLGFDHVSWGDSAWMPASMVPVGETGSLSNPGQEPEAEPVEDEEPDVDPISGEPLDESGLIGKVAEARNRLGAAMERYLTR